MSNLKALVESGRNMASLIQFGEVKLVSDDEFSITEFDDEIVMRFKKRPKCHINPPHLKENCGEI